MKKILAFILVLFPLMNFISKADWGVEQQQAQQRQWDQEAAYQQQQQQQQQYQQQLEQQRQDAIRYGGVAIDPITRQYGATWNYKNSNDAVYDAEVACGRNSNSKRCVSYWSSYPYTAVAISDDDTTVQFASSNTYEDAWKKALKKCENVKTILSQCEIAMMTSNSAESDEKLWGSIAYDPNNGASGTSWSQYTRKEARKAALQACKGNACAASEFQEKFGAMAISPDRGLYFGKSNKNMKDAEKDAIKGCKKEYKSKTCEIVVRAMAENQLNF